MIQIKFWPVVLLLLELALCAAITATVVYWAWHHVPGGGNG